MRGGGILSGQYRDCGIKGAFQGGRLPMHVGQHGAALQRGQQHAPCVLGIDVRAHTALVAGA